MDDDGGGDNDSIAGYAHVLHTWMENHMQAKTNCIAKKDRINYFKALTAFSMEWNL